MEKTNKKYNDTKIKSWIAFQSILIIIGAVGASLFVQYASVYFYGSDKDTMNWKFSLGLIIPLCVVLGALNNYLIKASYKYFSVLSDGIEKISNGNFDVQLNEKNAGPFSDVYHNFNKMGKELQNVQILRNDFINSYSHEFKTPITSINGFANLLLETDVTEDEKEKYLKIIADESARLADLANSTILLSKLDSQTIVSDRKPYSLDEQLRRCVIMLSSNWSHKDITFLGEMEEVVYNGNAELMQHLWLNLLNNAVKYTPKHGEVDVSLTHNDDTIIVEIKDVGIGMSEDEVAHIFEKYYQAEVLEARQGLGLGLSIVKRIVELCNGTIEVKSKKNEGSTFVITLPK